MKKLKYGILAVAAIFMMAPETQAQNFTQRGTRTGAIAGAIIGGIVGGGRDRPIAGAAIGGLIGGVAGNAIGNAQDNRFYRGGYGHSFHNRVPVHIQPGHHRGFQSFHGRPTVVRPVYGGGFQTGGFHHGGFGGFSNGRVGCGW